jgi:hypothetical protein
METAVRAYYQALLRRDFLEAQRLYRLVALTDAWSAEALQRESHKCGIYDEADRIDSFEDPGSFSIGPVTAAIGLLAA